MLLYAIMDSSAMPALSVYCSPEGSVPSAPLHNVGNCLPHRHLARIGTEYGINLAVISLICLEWHLPQVREASVSFSNISHHALTCNLCCVPWQFYITYTNARAWIYCFISVLSISWAVDIKWSPKCISRMGYLPNGLSDLWKGPVLVKSIETQFAAWCKWILHGNNILEFIY